MLLENKEAKSLFDYEMPRATPSRTIPRRVKC